jgi:hypothetical protein
MARVVIASSADAEKIEVRPGLRGIACTGARIACRLPLQQPKGGDPVSHCSVASVALTWIAGAHPSA